MAEDTATKKAPVKAAEKKTVPKTAPKKAVKAHTEEFSVIETGGKQYMVSVGDIIDVELLGDFKEGDKIEFDKVLLSDNGKDATIGDPYIKGAKVKATYQELHKGKKLSIIRFKAKSNFDRKIGHRQKYSRVIIDAI